MNDASTHSHDDDGILNRVKDEIGTFTPAQDAEILRAIRANADGVLDLARRVANNPAAQSKPGVFLASLRRGDHHAAGGRPARPSASATDKAHALFTAKYRDLVGTTDWSNRERRLHAVDYALQECGAWGPALLAIEDELRAELDATLDGTERDFERDTEHRRLMRATHGPSLPSQP